VRVTRLGHRVYTEKIVEQRDPRGRTHYWIGGSEPRWEALEGTDMAAIHDGFVAVSPVHLDLTAHRTLVQMADWSGTLSAQLKRSRDRTS
jgi:5'-nucleotidase